MRVSYDHSTICLMMAPSCIPKTTHALVDSHNSFIFMAKLCFLMCLECRLFLYPPSRHLGCFSDLAYTSAAKNILVCILGHIFKSICIYECILRAEMSGAQSVHTSNFTGQCHHLQSHQAIWHSHKCVQVTQ